MSAPSPRLSPQQRGLGALGAAAGLTVVFAGALVFSIVVHLDLAPTRRVARCIVNVVLGSTFKGKIVVGELDHLSLTGISVRSATALDPRGAEVGRLDGIRVRADVVGIVGSALGGRLAVNVSLIHIDHADVSLARSPSGGLGLAEVFQAAHPKPSKPDAVSPLVTLSRIELDHGWAHGEVTPSTAVDADVRGAVASVLLDSSGMTVKVLPARVEVRAPVPQPLVGEVVYDMHIPPALPAPGPMRLTAGFDGRVGELEVHTRAAMDGNHVSAQTEVPRATAEAIAALIPGKPAIPLRVPIALTAEADGDLPEIRIDAKVAFEGGGALDTRCALTVAAPLRLDAGFTVDGVDPRVVLAVPSATPLRAKGRVRLELGSETAIEASVDTEPLEIAGQVVPSVEAHAALAHGEWSGGVSVDELGAPTTGSFSFDRAGLLRFQVESRAASLRAVPRLRAPVDGRVRVKIGGSLRGGELDATVAGSFSELRAPGEVAVGSGDVRAHVHGPIAALEVDASVRGAGVRAQGYSWERAEVHVKGPLAGPGALRAGAKLGADDDLIEAEAGIDIKESALRDVRLHIERQGGAIDGEVHRVAAGAGGVVIEGIALRGDGVGALHGGLAVRHKELVGTLHARDMDLEKVSKLAGLPVELAGLANVDVDLTASGPGRRHGHIDLELAGGKVEGLGDISALMSATFDGDHVRLDSLVRVIAHGSADAPQDERCDGSIAQLRVTGGDGRLRGPLLDPATLRRASGEMTVAMEDVNLRCVAQMLPEIVPFSDVRGKLTARATVARRSGARLPSVRELLVRTRGLQVAGQGWESRSVDVELKGSLDAASGRTQARVSVRDDSTIVFARADATLDLPALLDRPDLRWASLRSAPLSARLIIPRRAVSAFKTLPTFVRGRLPPLDGEVRLDASLEGSIEKPYAVIQADGWDLAHSSGAARKLRRGGLRPAEESPWAAPVDLTAKATYDGRAARVEAHVIHAKQAVADLDAHIGLPLADVLAKQPIKPRGDVHLKLTKVPVKAIPYFAERGVEGHLDGSVALEGLGEAPRVKVDLGLSGLKLGHELPYEVSSVAVDIGRRAKAHVELKSKVGGKLELKASSGVLWRDGLVPGLDPAEHASVSLEASRFRIAALGPFVAGSLSRIDGVLDGEARADLAKLAAKPKIVTRLKLSDGVFHVPQLGQELHDAQVTVVGGAGGVVELAGIRADGAKGRITGSGRAKFDGLRFVRADASFEIKPGEELPVTFEGVPFGDARAKIKVAAEQRGRVLAITVGIPSLHIDLPASSGRGVQSLDANPEVIVLGERRQVVKVSPNAGRTSLTFNLGHVEVKGKALDIGLSGVKRAPIKIDLLDKARISGDIQLTHGRIEVLHKPFMIEQGVVHLRPEEPGNPYVNVTARWDAPDGPIFIEYAGLLLPIAPEKLKYRSPTIPQDKIMATLLFGGVEQATVSGQGAGAVPGQALAAQLIAQQFSTQIAGNISTSIAANDDGTLRPGLTYNSGDKVIEVSTYEASGQGASSMGATTAKGQHTQVTVDWRFFKEWLLRGRIDVGSDQTQTTLGGDVLWQHRY